MQGHAAVSRAARTAQKVAEGADQRACAGLARVPEPGPVAQKCGHTGIETEVAKVYCSLCCTQLLAALTFTHIVHSATWDRRRLSG